MGDGRPVPRCMTTRSGQRAEREGGLCHSYGLVTGEASAHSRRCLRADPSPVRQILHPLVHQRIPHARQVEQLGTFAVSSSVEGLWCIRQEVHRYSRMCPLILSWIYHRFSGISARVPDIDAWPLTERLIGYQQQGRDQQEGRLLHWRSWLDRVTLDEVLRVYVSLDSIHDSGDAGSYLELDAVTGRGIHMEISRACGVLQLCAHASRWPGDQAVRWGAAGLDELFNMTSCPSAEFISIVESFRVTRAQHVEHGSSSFAAPPPPPPPASNVQHGPWIPTYLSPSMMGYPVFDPSHVGSEYATPPSYHAPSSYHSYSFDRHSAPTPTMTHPAPDPPASNTPVADPPPTPHPADLTGPSDLPLVVLEVTFIHAATATVNEQQK
ncbi:hypothetical protein PIB30_035378 [Stylosanthes scabra]|uniref:Uncharacterized protein n=1 Tax=Stylosanthes scabra TaxID=79078 RepID=A0ABU6XDX9_9FABA|nr:hypothetical protein [Stylosanthes scabra]